MRRRIFLKGVAGILALASVAAKRKSDDPKIAFDKNLVSVVLGPAFDGQAEFSIVHSQRQTVTYLVFQENRLIENMEYTSVTSPYDSFRIDKFLVRNLPLETDLTLKIYADNRLIDERQFSTISSQGSSYDIGLVSCMRASQHEKEMWNSLEAQNSDLLLFIGDCVYIDTALDGTVNPKLMWTKFVESRMVLQFYHWKKLVPVVAMWDDHDFGGNNSNRKFKFAKEAQTNFKNFFAQNLSESSFISAGPGISCKFQLGNQLFLMLDGRSFREPSKSGKLYSLFGKEQEDWIFDSIKNFDGLIWMNSGSQWFTTKGYGESFRKDHKINFNTFMEKLNNLDKKVIFTSGDVHYSEVCETPLLVKNKSLEITSSCMHSSYSLALPRIGQSENRIASAWQQNYVVCKTIEIANRVLLEIGCFTKRAPRIFGVNTEIDIG